MSLPRGDSRALAASATAIALTIGSAFFNTRDKPGGGVTVRREYVGWKPAYAAVKMAVEAVKESSDLYLPLKAAVGAVSILMKNFDVSVSYLQTENVLIFQLLPALANLG